MSLSRRRMLRSFTLLKTKGEVAPSRLFSMSLPKPMRPFSKSSGRACRICQMLKPGRVGTSYVPTHLLNCLLDFRVGTSCPPYSAASLVNCLNGVDDHLDDRRVDRGVGPDVLDRSLDVDVAHLDI